MLAIIHMSTPSRGTQFTAGKPTMRPNRLDTPQVYNFLQSLPSDHDRQCVSDYILAVQQLYINHDSIMKGFERELTQLLHDTFHPWFTVEEFNRKIEALNQNFTAKRREKLVLKEEAKHASVADWKTMKHRLDTIDSQSWQTRAEYIQWYRDIFQYQSKLSVEDQKKFEAALLDNDNRQHQSHDGRNAALKLLEHEFFPDRRIVPILALANMIIFTVRTDNGNVKWVILEF